MTYIFYRAEGFYPIELPDEWLAIYGEAKYVKDNAEANPGTLKIERLDGTTVWQPQEGQ